MKTCWNVCGGKCRRPSYLRLLQLAPGGPDLSCCRRARWTTTPSSSGLSLCLDDTWRWEDSVKARMRLRGTSPSHTSHSASGCTGSGAPITTTSTPQCYCSPTALTCQSTPLPSTGELCPDVSRSEDHPGCCRPRLGRHDLDGAFHAET